MGQDTGRGRQSVTPSGRRFRVEEVQEHGGSTTLELFFDLVFVFALTQVTALAADLRPHGFLRGVLILAIVWWCWVGYSWVSNHPRDVRSASGETARF